jgi:hypothetical protein
MCARRFLAIIFFLTLLAVAGALAIFQWGGNVLLSQATPQGHFRESDAGSGPDYSTPATWIARPDIPNNPSAWLPQGYKPKESVNDAAVFYIHPTTYLDRDRWNAPLAGNATSDARADLFVRSQASAFASAGPVWAPRYRQAAYGAFLLNNRDAQQALDLAYRDVSGAFDKFLADNGGRPVILAGHSQGALHLARLIQEKGAQLKGRLVAAYVVGWPISTKADLPPMGFPACSAANQAGCILSWQSFAEPANASLILDPWQKSIGAGGAKRQRKDILCVNPLSGTKDGAASAASNPGTLFPSPDLKSGSLVRGQVGATCKNGILIIDGAMSTMGPYVSPGNTYHVYDYALFWEAIRQDALNRLEAWASDPNRQHS